MRLNPPVFPFHAASLVLLGACAQPPAPAPSRPQPAHSAAAEAPPPLRARWVRSAGATRIGPALPQGTMVLLGGRRALVRTDGSVIPEKAPAPEPLHDIVLVPAPGGDRLVGHGDHTVYRFDDPLGAPTALVGAVDRVEIEHVGAGPGVAIVFGRFWERFNDPAPPMVIDVVTGEQKKLEGWPEVDLRDVVFRTMNEGAALFAGLGLGLTRDGGKTFFAPVMAKPEEAPYFARLGRRGEAFSVWRGVFHAPLDLAKGRVGPFSREAPPGLSPTLEWIARTAADPLAIAVAEGTLDPRGKLVIAVDGVAARVDPATGGVLEVAHFGDTERERNRTLEREFVAFERYPRPLPECLSAHLPGQGLLLCPELGARRFSIDGPLDPRLFQTFDPSDHRYKARDFVYRPGGGFAFVGYCSKREGTDRTSAYPLAAERICALQKGAALQTIEPPKGAPIFSEHGLGALSDGRVVFLDRDPRSNFFSDGDPLPKQFFHVFDGRGEIRKLPPLPLGGSPFPATVLGAIEEGADGALYALLADGNGLRSVRQPWNEPATLTPLPANTGELRRGHGVALGEEMLVSSDAGATFTPVGPWPPLPESGTRDELVVGEGGVLVGDWLRVGWGEGEPFAQPNPVAAAPIVLPSKPPTEAVPRRVVCKSLGALGPSPPLSRPDVMAELFDRARGPLPAKGKQHSPDLYLNWSLDGFFTRHSSFAEDEKAQTPTRWVMQYLDPRDIPAKVHTWTGAPPPGAAFQVWLDGVFRAGDRTVLSVRHRAPPDSDSNALFTWDIALLSPKGEARWTRMTQVERDTGWGATLSVTLGEGEDDPIVLKKRSGLFVWDGEGPPRALPPAGDVKLGVPRGKTIPVLLRSLDGFATRELSLDVAKDAPSWLPFDGWRFVRLPSKNPFESIEACGPKSAGSLFRGISMNGKLVFVIDGKQLERDLHSRYDIRVNEGAACLAGVETMFQLTHPVSPFGFVKADFPGRSGHGVEMGRSALVRRLECSLE